MSPMAWLLAMQGASQPQRGAEARGREEPGGTHGLASAWLRADALWPGPQRPAAREG